MKTLNQFFEEIGGLALFVIQVLKLFIFKFKSIRPLLFEQLAQVGLRSLPTVCFAGFFVGAILIIQFHMMLSEYDALYLLGGLNSSACIREVGPLIISFLLAGKVGAYTTAELGTMRVTEQIDAIRCLGTDPIEYLIVPRFIAIVISSLFLLVFGLMVGILGSMAVASIYFNINLLQYMSSIPKFTTAWTIFGGIFKSGVYGTIVASVSTYKGYNTTGGAKGVGIAVTQCAIFTNLFIVLANSGTSIFLNGFHHIYNDLVGF